MKNNFRINLNCCYISFLPENPEHYTLILTLEADRLQRGFDRQLKKTKSWECRVTPVTRKRQQMRSCWLQAYRKRLELGVLSTRSNIFGSKPLIHKLEGKRCKIFPLPLVQTHCRMMHRFSSWQIFLQVSSINRILDKYSVYHNMLRLLPPQKRPKSQEV